MKKTISINLQGIIFHVEDDGYALLNNYLTSVKAYFSTFDGHEEIMADIESRMAEIFLTRQNPGKQIVTLEDVQYLIGRMGSVADFAAQAEEEETAYNHAHTNQRTYASGNTYTSNGQKRLYRDESRKMLAGVSAGIANYLNIDPLWIRLLFIVLLFSTFGVAVVGYIILWMVLPVNASLPETGVKKLYRDPDDKKLAGVSSGIGHYFGIDPMWIRLFFVALVLVFGTGVIAYIILWIIMPEAKTNSEKAEMRGNPVTLSSIEAAIRNNAAFKDGQGGENTFARLLLLPVKLLSALLEAVGPALKAIILFLLTFIRIAAGIILTLTGLSFIAAAVALLVSGFSPEVAVTFVNTDALPFSMIMSELPWYGLISGFLVIFIPALLLTILGLSLLAKRTLMRQNIGWTLFGLFIFALFATATAAAIYATNFKQTAYVTEDIRFPSPQNRPLQLLLARDEDQTFEYYDINIVPGKDSGAVVISAEYKSKGANRKDAETNARMLNLPVSQTDSALVFSKTLQYKPGAVFRSQKIDLTVQIPQGQPFTFEKDLSRKINFAGAASGAYNSQLANQTLVFEAGKLRCLTCTVEDSAQLKQSADIEIPAGAASERFNFRDFSTVNAAGNLKVIITKADVYQVVAHGPKNGLSSLEIKNESGELNIDSDEDLFKMGKHEAVTIEIKMPELQHIVLAGAVKGSVIGFDTDRFEASLVGASELEMDIKTRDLKADLVGASSMTVTGMAENLEAQIIGASDLDALGLQTQTADVEAAGASKAKVQVKDRLKAHANGASSIRYSGNPQSVEKDVSGAASIESNHKTGDTESW